MRAGKDNLHGNPGDDESTMDAPLNYNDMDDAPGAIITWQLPRKDNIPDDEIIFEEEVDSGQAFIDEFGRPFLFHLCSSFSLPETALPVPD